MIRVLHLPGTISLNNGRMHVIMNVYREIDRSKFQFDFLATDTEEQSFADEIHKLGGRVYTIPQAQKNNFFKLFQALRSLLKSNSYKYVHYHATSQWVAVLFGLRKYKVEQLIIHSHATVYSDSYIKSVRNFLLSVPALLSANKYVGATYEAAQGIFFNKKFEVIQNSIDVEKFSFSETERYKLRKKLRLKDTDILLGNVGRYSKQKNQVFLINIFYNIIKRDDANNWFLLLIGQGNAKKQLIERATQLGIIDKIIFLKTQSNIQRYYFAMDIFCFPSIYEGFGMAALEAQATGLPTIVSDVIPDAIKLKNSFELSLKSSALNWSDLIISVVKSQHFNDRHKATSVIKDAHLDSNSIVHKWEELYSVT